MVDREILSWCLRTVKHDQDTKTARETIETVLTIHRNILENDKVGKYRRIRLKNPAFSKKVWSLHPARLFMLKCGWIEEDIPGDPIIVFNCDERLYDIIDIIVDHRHIVPSEHEWKDTKLEGKSESQLKEEALRRKANMEKQKELVEFAKDKEYRKRLAQSIKNQIESDKKRRKQIFTGPVVGNKLVKGAGVKTLNSLSKPDDENARK